MPTYRLSTSHVHTYPCAASVSLARLLCGRFRPVTLAVALPAASYLRTADATDVEVLCLAGPDAVRVPCALVVGPGTPLPPPGCHGVVGDGLLAVGGHGYRVARWWRPPRAPALDGVDSSRLREATAVLATAVRAEPVVDLVQPGRDGALAQLAAALRATSDTAVLEPHHGGPGILPGAVAALLGRGGGATPFGDDVLAGALVTLHAVHRVAALRLAAAVRAAMGPAGSPATTTVSAALLDAAARGECVPQLADVLAAMASGPPPPDAVAALLGLGHSSGAGLAWGVVTALAAVTFDDAPLGRRAAGSARVGG